MVGIRSVAIGSDGQIMIAAREGAYRSEDGGATWEHVVNGLPGKDITSVSFDSTHKRLLATSDATGVIFESQRRRTFLAAWSRQRLPAAPG